MTQDKQIDASIRDHIHRLNNYGYVTTHSCSGVLEDHKGRDSSSFAFGAWVAIEYIELAPHTKELLSSSGWRYHVCYFDEKTEWEEDPAPDRKKMIWFQLHSEIHDREILAHWRLLLLILLQGEV